MASTESSSSILGALSSLGANLFGGMEDLAKLVSLELQEEKLRLIQTSMWIAGVFLSFAMAVAFASLALVYVWREHALAVLVGLAGFYALSTIAAILAFRRHLARQPRPLAETIEELAEDCACFPKQN
jgi:uncharacterized membrane protein YqjE